MKFSKLWCFQSFAMSVRKTKFDHTQFDPFVCQVTRVDFLSILLFQTFLDVQSQHPDSYSVYLSCNWIELKSEIAIPTIAPLSLSALFVHKVSTGVIFPIRNMFSILGSICRNGKE